MRAIRYTGLMTAWVALALLTVSGCGSRVNLAASDNPDEITPPSTPGTSESLLGTSWVFKGLDMTVTFYGQAGNPSDPIIDENAATAPAMTAVLSNPADPSQSLTGYWRLRPNGVISVSVIGNTRAGTWDGNTLVLGGETGRSVASP